MSKKLHVFKRMLLALNNPSNNRIYSEKIILFVDSLFSYLDQIRSHNTPSKTDPVSRLIDFFSPNSILFNALRDSGTVFAFPKGKMSTKYSPVYLQNLPDK